MPTKHNHELIFGRRVAGCPRCAELDAGAPARQGWGAKKRADEARRLAAIRNHNCKASGCNAVCCTAFDW
jgi:hypothetical protein